jgi:hypothetical protein
MSGRLGSARVANGGGWSQGQAGQRRPVASSDGQPEAAVGDGADTGRPVQRWPKLLRARQRAVAGARYTETERVR